MSLNVQVLRDSFKIAKDIAPEVMNKFYEFLFLDFPLAKPLFSEVNMENQKKALANSLVFIIDNLENSEKLSEYLRQMGKRHYNYGVKPEHYDMVGGSLLKTFAFFFQDKWTKELNAEWAKAFGVIKDLMLEGASYAEPSDDVIRKRAKLIGNKLILKAIEAELDKGIETEIRAKVRKLIFEIMDAEYKKMFSDAPMKKDF